MTAKVLLDARDISTHFDVSRGMFQPRGTVRAVDGVSFQVGKGEVLGVLGPNGAGKSTTMRMLAGFMIPTEGTASICGHDVQTDSVAARRELGFLPEGAPTYPEMAVSAFLTFCAKIRGYRGRELTDRVAEAIDMTGLQGVRLQPVETLSKGFKRRVGLAQALLHDPPVLVLDEPTEGIQPSIIKDIGRVIELLRSRGEMAILLVEQYFDFARDLAQTIAVMDRGDIVLSGLREDLDEADVRRRLSV